MNINTKEYIEQYIKIRDKAGNIIDFKLNKPQQKLYDLIKKQKELKKPVRIVILKARQMGFSTLTEAILFKEATTKFNINTGIITHQEEATTNLFEMSKIMYDYLPNAMKPSLRKSNAKELIFDTEDGVGLKSKIKCMTAGGKGVGRSNTFNNVHISELAFWPGNKKETLNGLMQAVPNLPNTIVIIESTANGFELFKDIYDDAVSGNNDFIPLFVAWFELEDYQMPYTGFELTREEKQLQKQYNLTLEQITWRRWCIRNNCNGDVEQFKQEYPSCPEEAFKNTGTSVFNKEQVINRIEELRNRKTIKTGYFLYKLNDDIITDIEWYDDPNGYIRIYEEPKKGYPYVIGGDTAGEGSDYNIGQVIDNTNDNQVAILDSNEIAEDIYAMQMYCLGKYYNWALMGIETNFSTYPVMKLKELDYPNQYIRKEAPDKRTGRLTKSYGFLTDKKTRNNLFAILVKQIRENIDCIFDYETLKEFLTIIKNEKGKPEAQIGYHDDKTMALGIAYSIQDQQTTDIEKEEEADEIKIPFELTDDEIVTDEYIGW